MALSGSNYKSFARHRLVAEWTATQNIAKNQSTVTVKVFLQSVDAYGAMSAPASNAGSVKVGTTTKNFTATSQLSAYQKKQLTSQSFVVNHNANGTGSFSYSVTYNINVTFAGVFYGNQTVSGSGTLNTIPRASSISSISGNQIGGVITVNISRASSTFKHIVKYTNTAGVTTNVGENVDTSKAFTIPISDCNHLPNATSGTAKITVDTYSGNTRIGSVTKNHTVYVPDNIVPSFNSIQVTELVSSIKNLNLGASNFVQGKSNIQVGIDGKTLYGATIVDSWVGIDGLGSINSHVGVFGLYYYPSAVGRIQVSGSIKDSRGRIARGNMFIEIVPFSSPIIFLFNGMRIGDGTSVEITKDIYASRIMGDKSGYMVLIDKKVGDSWVNIHSESNTNTRTVTLTGFDITKSYELRLRVLDYFQEIISVIHIATAKVLFDLNKDIGVGIGKLNEGIAMLEVDGSIKVTNGTITGGVGYETQYMPAGDMYNPSYWVSNFPLGLTLRFLSTQNVGNRPSNYMLFMILKFSQNDYRVLGFVQPSDNTRFFMLTGNQSQVSKWTQVNTVPV